MDDNSRLQLQNMIKANDVEDQTELIRELKHSYLLQDDINKLLSIKHKHNNDINKVLDEGVNECSFLFTYYTDIFNKLRKDEIDISILNKFLNVLRRIEEGEIGQHDGSFLIGTLLKEIYIDSALKKADKLNMTREKEEEEKEKEDVKVVPVEISWKQYKKII